MLLLSGRQHVGSGWRWQIPRNLVVAFWLLLAVAVDAACAAPAPAEQRPPDAKTKQEELTLNDLRDYGMALRVIQQQAINIYLEAVRSDVAPGAGPEIADVKSIPIDTGAKPALPARREWLIYYLTSMEPAIRLLGQEVTEVETGAAKVLVPDEMKDEAGPLWESWQKNVEVMNKHLDVLVPLFEDAPHNNTRVAAAAVRIFDDISKLEATRQETFKIIQKAQKQGTGKVMVQE